MSIFANEGFCLTRNFLFSPTKLGLLGGGKPTASDYALTKVSVLFGIQLDFVYNFQMNAMGYTTKMTLYDTFGAAIHSMCTDLEMHEKEWDFLFHALFQSQDTGHLTTWG